MKQYANLHFHSTHSDGVYTPVELAHLAKAEGYAAIALADHDTVTGNAECQREAQALGLRYIFAAEFSTASESYGASFHIVGMDFDPTFAPMAEYLEHMSYREAHQTKVLFERGVANGYLCDITWEEQLEALTLAIEHGLFISGGSDHSGLMGGQYDRYEDPRSSVHWIEPRTAGTGELFFEELLTRTLSPRAERERYLADFRRELAEIF